MKRHYAICAFLVNLVACGNGTDIDSTSPVVSLIVSPTKVKVGQKTDISWAATNAKTCEAEGDWSGGRALFGTEEYLIEQKKPYLFSIRCKDSYGKTASASAELSVEYPGELIDEHLYINNNAIHYKNSYTLSLNDKILVDIVRFEEAYFILWYDSSENTTGAQEAGANYTGLQAHMIHDDYVENISDLFVKSSFESLFKKTISEAGFIVCSNRECYFFYENGGANFVDISDYLNGYEIDSIEYNNGILSLFCVRQQLRQRLGEVDITDYDLKRIDFNRDLVLIGDAVTLDMPLNFTTLTSNTSNLGFGYAFQDNSEGRIVWGQKYLFDALSFKENLHLDEMELVHRSINYYLGFSDVDFLFSERYSFRRQPQLFLLHVSRYYNLLKEAETSVIPDLIDNYNLQISLLEDMLTLSSSKYKPVEIFDEFYFDNIGCRPYLIFSPDSDFWANSVNVPVNYTSDYIIALLNVGSDTALEIAVSLLETNYLLLDELQSTSWRYWLGAGLTGWDDQQINRPSFSGLRDSPYAAHIIYRSADAEAFLKACSDVELSNALSFDCVSLRQRLLRFIGEGSLQPFLLGYFPDVDARQVLSEKVQRKFARRVYISDLKNHLYLQSIFD